MSATLIAAIAQQLLANAPQEIEAISLIAEKLKALIDALFTAKSISNAQQNALHAHVDGLAELAKAGIIPDHWKVEPDPK